MQSRPVEEEKNCRTICRADLLRKRRIAEQFVEDQIYKTE
jgi:hypothetical protein